VIELEEFLAAAPTPWHAAAQSGRILSKAGFSELDPQREEWPREGEGAFVRSGGFLLAWRWPEHAKALRIAVAHTDSPCLRVKPRPERRGHGAWSLGVETYGGMLLHTWFDRELEICGRVFLEDGNERLVRLPSPRPVLPSLAIHLDREVNDKGLQLNRELHLPPLVGLDDGSDWSLARSLAAELACPAEAILGWELCLSLAEPPARLGHAGELLLSGRIDNLASCHALLEALLEARPKVGAMPILAFFDGEEIGSEIAAGARSRTLSRLLERISMAMGLSRSRWLALLSEATGLSVDMAHAVHPNRPEKHDPGMAPLLGRGPVLKTNASYRYATDAKAAALLRQTARKAGIALQEFAMRADLPCGSTVGPAIASELGIPVADCGAPMLGMHSARELFSMADHHASTRLYRVFLEG
jgi:aspartyl aminopeptidase